MISVTVTNRKAVAVPLTDVTVGAVGIPVSFHFSEDWDGLSKIAVFKAGDVTPVEVAILNNTAVVPHEVLVDEYEVLWIGIYGSNAQGTTVIPTIWANAGAIQPGTELETVDPSEPTPSWVAQVQAAAEEALTIANEIKDDAESGAFDGEDGTDGVSPTVTVTDITGGHLVTITDANGSHSFSVMNGADGQNGSDGQPGANGSDGRDGVDGQDGTDGISPTITIVNIDGGHRVTMTDVNGSHSFDVLNGQDGSTGSQGETGPAGATGAAGRGIRAFYPNGTSTVGDVTYDSYLMEFTDDTTFTLNVRRGAKGDVGPAGNDGITPTVEVTEIEGGHNVAFDYGTGDSRNRDFDVMDGGQGDDKAPVITDTASGAIASFPDGADGLPLKRLVAQIEPQQDLHGYDSPWPAGGGKNKLPLVLSAIKTANTAGTWNGNAYTINGITYTLTETDGYVSQITANGTATGSADININISTVLADGTYIMNGCPSGGTGDTYYLRGTRGFVGLDTGNGSVQVTYNSGASLYLYIHFASGVSASNLVFKPMIRLSSVTDATFAPFANECPISGWTGAEVVQTGINLFDKSTIITGKYYNKAGAETLGNYYFHSVLIPVVPSEQYTIVAPLNAGMWNVVCFDTNKNGINEAWQTDGTGKKTITIPANCYYVAINGKLNTDEDVISLNYPATDHDYHAYTGDSLSINWQDSAGTVYGGNLAINEDGSCKLTVGMAIVDLGTLDWNVSDRRFNTLTPITNAKGGNHADCLCSIYKSDVGAATRAVDCSISFANNGYVYIYDTTFSGDASAFKAAMNGVQLCYELATPVTYTLPDVTMLETVLGTNNIWVDTGDTTVEYRADTKKYIQKIIAQALNS